MKLWAISDLHAGHADNRRVIRIPAQPGDWLALVGDVGEPPRSWPSSSTHCDRALAACCGCPAITSWTYPKDSPLRGEAGTSS